MKKIELPPKNCLNCGAEFTRDSCRQISDFREKKYCSRKCCKDHKVGSNHPNWKGGIKTRLDGYIRRSSDDKYLHRVVMEEFIGRELSTDEIVHHINEDTSDNRLENLEILTNSEHRKLHCKTQKRNEKGAFCE